MHEVYAYGVLAPSTLIELEGGFPSEAGYGEIVAFHPSFGGEAAGGAYVLARLGIPTKLAGNRLANDGESRRVIATLSAAGVDCSAIALDDDPPVTEIVFSAAGERTVFGTYSRMLTDKSWSQPSRRDIESSRFVCLDPFFGDESRKASQWCREGQIPYVTVDTVPESDIARFAAALVISEEYANRTFDTAEPAEILAAYTGSCRGLVILTQGREPLLFGRGGEAPQCQAPFSVAARDTTGAGDSFRAGVIYGLLRGRSDEEIVRTASAVAAMVCQTAPGVLHSPTEGELNEFLEDRT